jgi:dTDP-4-amino-4,6-dideoxygalactose transaminase
MRGHGMTSGTFQRLSSQTPHYDVTMLGYNYRMDDLRAAIGLTQLGRLHNWNKIRQALTDVYRKAIAQYCPAISVPFARNNVSAHHIMPVLLPLDINRDGLVAGLRKAGIQTTIHYPPVHQLSFYHDRFPSVRLPKTEEFFRRELTLPLHPRMDEGLVERVVTALANELKVN